MKLEVIKYFLEIIKEQSIARASEKLFITPQALSVAIKRLEGELNIKLFNKTSNGFTLTEAGHIYYDFANVVQKEYTNLIVRLDAYLEIQQKNKNERINVYHNILTKDTVVAETIKIFCNENPDVKLHLYLEDVKQVYERFSCPGNGQEELQIAFVQIPKIKKLHPLWLASSQYVFQPLFTGRYVAFASKNSNLEDVESIYNILKYPIVFFATNEISLIQAEHPISNPLLLLLKQYGDINISFSANNSTMWNYAVSNGIGIGFLHCSMLNNNLINTSNLKIIKIKEPLESTIGCLVPTYDSPLISKMLKIATELTKKYNN